MFGNRQVGVSEGFLYRCIPYLTEEVSLDKHGQTSPLVFVEHSDQGLPHSVVGRQQADDCRVVSLISQTRVGTGRREQGNVLVRQVVTNVNTHWNGTE